MWLAAEHGMFLRQTEGNWMTTMPENLSMDWVDSVKVKHCTFELELFQVCEVFRIKIYLFCFSMYLSISRRGPPVLILSFVRPHLFGTINIQVINSYPI